MVAILPNRKEIEGKILSLKPDKKRTDFHVMRVQLIRITGDQEEWILPDNDVKSKIGIFIADQVVKENKLKKGMLITCVIRKAPHDEYFIIPDSIHVTSAKKSK